MNLLYVTWDGPEDNYLNSLFFPVFSRLRELGVRTHVLQFSWEIKRFASQVQASAREYGVSYEVHAVPRWPIQFATALAISTGALVLGRTGRRIGADVVMPRAHIPGAMALLARPHLRDARLIWDSDGLMPDERVEFGGWPADGLLYRFFRILERRLVRSANKVITRTAAASQILQQRVSTDPSKFSVVANGKDAQQFRPATDQERAEVRASLGVASDTPLLIYVGSIGPQYRPREMARCFSLIRQRRPDAHFLLLTRAQDLAASALREEGLPASSWTVRRVAPEEVAGLVRSADCGISLREPSMSMRAVCPIKVAEYLLSGLPVLANAGVGDLDTQFHNSPAASIAPDFTRASLDGLAAAFVGYLAPDRVRIRENARVLGLAQFSISNCVAGYHRAFL